MDLDDDLDTLPIAEIIAALRRDLGLDPHRTTRGISPVEAPPARRRARALRPRSKAQRDGSSRRPDQGPAPRHRPAETLTRLPAHDVPRRVAIKTQSRGP